MKNKNTLQKSKEKNISVQKTPFVAIILVIVCTLFTASGQYLIKKGLFGIKITDFASMLQLINIYLIGGFLIYAVGAILLIKALRRGSLSVLYPIIALGFIWVALLGTLVLGENLTIINWLGILSIICGVTFVGLSESQNNKTKKSGGKK